jgi:hypothetical protein
MANKLPVRTQVVASPLLWIFTASGMDFLVKIGKKEAPVSSGVFLPLCKRSRRSCESMESQVLKINRGDDSEKHLPFAGFVQTAPDSTPEKPTPVYTRQCKGHLHGDYTVAPGRL